MPTKRVEMKVGKDEQLENIFSIRMWLVTQLLQKKYLTEHFGNN